MRWVIPWIRRANIEQRKLMLSVGINFLTRIPGAVGLLWFLPLLHIGLGTDEYANLLSLLSVGTVASFLFSGISTAGRRIIGEAYSDRNRVEEANGFVSLVFAYMVALIFALAIIGGFWWKQGGSTLLVITIFPVAGSFLQMFDEVRAAYNELYIGSGLFIVIQSVVYAVGLLLPVTRHDMILGALVITGPYILASLTTFVLLLHHKPYLISGRPVIVWTMVRHGTRLAIADGSLMTILSLSVVWLQSVDNASVAAWYATIVRLFQTFCTPIILLLLPLSSYIRLRWNSKSIVQQQAFARTTFLMGLGYGAMVAVALMIASRLYIGWLLNLPVPGDLSVFLLFGAIIAYKSYSSIAYVVLDETVHLSAWTTAATATAAAMAAVASFYVNPLDTIGVYAIAGGVLVIGVTFWNAARFIKPFQKPEGFTDGNAI